MDITPLSIEIDDLIAFFQDDTIIVHDTEDVIRYLRLIRESHEEIDSEFNKNKSKSA